jgi:hypothetical protein
MKAYLTLLINFHSALKVLKGASAITGAPGEGVFELFVVPVVNMLEMHPPAHARFLPTLLSDLN